MKNAFCISLLTFSPLVSAMPSLTNRCAEKGIHFIPPDNTTLVAYDENCETAFIGPPQEGKIYVNQVMGSTNLLFCDTVKSLPKTVEAIRKGIQYWADRLAKKSLEYDEVSKETIDYTKKLAELKPLVIAKQKTLEIREGELRFARNQMAKAKERYDDCLAKSPGSCGQTEKDLDIAYRIVNSKRDIVGDIELDIIELETKIRREEGKIKEINERIDQLTQDFEKYKRLLTGLENDALDGYQRYGQLYGATATVNFHADWSILIKEAQQKNRYLSMHVAQMPLIATKVDISTAIPKGFGIKNMSTLLGARVPGFDTYSADTPQKLDLDSEMSLNPIPWATTMTGQVDFNLIGACRMVDENSQILLPKADDEIGAMLAVNLQHTYPMMMKRNYQISFDTKKIVSEMEKVVESGGFLSASKIHQLAKYNMDSDKLNVIFYDEGGHTTYTDEEKRQITADAKYEILDKILNGMNAIPQYSERKSSFPRLDRSTGARFIYEDMPCFGYAICYATGFIIGVVDAIFGSTEAAAEFTKTNMMSITHKYSSRSPGYRILTSNFSRHGK
jgi:uncharacterized coiled-coil protein SlyX